MKTHCTNWYAGPIPTGVCRARLASEIPVSSPYRQCRLDYGPFEHDLTEEDGELEGFDRERLVAALSAYLRRRSLEIDWDTAEQAPPEPLINSLRTVYPEARISTPSRNKIRLELPSGDVLRFYVNP